jgi:riboflavin synthase
MFTGIVIGTGTVKSVREEGGGTRVTLRAPRIAKRSRAGDSVALNGCCLTAVSVRRPFLSFQAVPETLKRTNLGTLKAGDPVNLELPLGASDRFGGHLVQGHVDGQGTVTSIRRTGLGWTLGVRLPGNLARYVVMKGSIALDGISLTVASLKGCDVKIAIIPHTWEVTNLRRRKTGDKVNVEVDVLAKHIEKLVAPYRKALRRRR